MGKYIWSCKNSRLYGAQFERMRFAHIVYHNVTPWLILSFFSLYHLVDFTWKWPSQGKTDVALGKNEKLGVDPPPSPTTPASYRQLF